MKKVYITGIGPDRPGIVAAMTEVLAHNRGNLEDTTMTILGRQFALIMIGSFPADIPLERICEEYATTGRNLGLTIFVHEFDEEGEHKTPVNKNPYIISVAGHDRTGITFEITRILSKFRVNITDLNAQIIEGEEGQPVYIMMIECDMPKDIERELFERELAMMGESLNVEITYHPVEHVAL